jgi:hypothetical protein
MDSSSNFPVQIEMVVEFQVGLCAGNHRELREDLVSLIIIQALLGRVVQLQVRFQKDLAFAVFPSVSNNSIITCNCLQHLFQSYTIQIQLERQR